MQKRLIILAIAVVAITVAIGFVAMQPDSLTGSDTAQQSVETGVIVGKKLPAFTLDALDGKPAAITAGGGVIILNFWATWCPPCRQEMPDLDVFARKHGGKVAFYAVNIQESAGQVTEFMTQNKYTMNVLLDKDGAVANTFRINAIPTTLVVDKQGVIKYRKSGPVTMAELEGVLNGL